MSLNILGENLQTKSLKGLGFRNMKTVNDAYMCKLVWKLVTNPEKL